MDMKLYRVTFSPDNEKVPIIRRGQNKVEVVRRAYILLKSHDGKNRCRDCF
jgi:hypothetical protein